MRLELEQNHSQIAFVDAAEAELSDEQRAAEAAEHLRQGIKAAQSGNRAAARSSLLRAAELDPRSESAWLWLSSISEYPEELLAFLTNVLDINPLNARALEWSAATRSLLAKNFVQRGIDAVESGQQEIAVQHFNQALEYDERNSMAWLWLASLSDSNEGKLTYLEKVLEFDPENETAKGGYTAAKNGIRERLLAEARAAAVAGKGVEANELLDAILAEEPNAEDAWVLRAHIASDFEVKIAAFRRILEINPSNAAAKSGLESLSSIMDAVTANVPAETVFEEAMLSSFDESQTTELSEPVEAVADAPVEPEWQDVQEAISDPFEPVEPPVFCEAAQNDSESASPFDNYANEPAANFDSTMFFTVPPAVETNDEYVERSADGADKESGYEFEPAGNSIAAEEPEQFDVEYSDDLVRDFEVSSPAHDGVLLAERNDTPFLEEITYDIAPDEVSEPNYPEASAEYSKADDQPLHETAGMDEIPAQADFDEGPAISAPSSNPFDSAVFKGNGDEFKTVLSIDLDPEMQAAVQNYNPSIPAPGNPGNGHEAFDAPFDMTFYGSKIPMPEAEFNSFEAEAPNPFATRIVQSTEVTRTAASTISCSFCETENDVQAIMCNGCMAVLTLADLELILANQHADKAVLKATVEKMEREKETREISEAELTILGIGHLNLRNLQVGYDYLQEASQKNPNNVVLSGQANALHIRLEEIRKQDEVHEAMTRGKTILVVDDSPTVRKLIAGKLEKCGHEVFCSSDGVEAMERLEDLRPDLILLDITMPRMDGYQVCKLIRSNDATKDVPVIMISGKDGFFDKVRGRMAGTSGYITKPFGPETLMKAVESYLRPEA